LLTDGIANERQQDLERHLGQCSACQQTLDELAGNPADWRRWKRLLRDDTKFRTAAVQRAADHILQPGMLDRMKAAWGNGSAPNEPASTTSQPVVPGFEILRELGRGGTAVVYKARQRSLGRLVALKVILAGKHAGTSRQSRFRQEAEAVAKLHHPNIVQIYETGEHDGLPYIALEFVAGSTLATRIHGVPQSPRESAVLIATSAEAVHSAHQNRILHRDLKPANILLSAECPVLNAEKKTTENTPGTPGSLSTQHSALSTPKITDFGLAMLLDDEAEQTRSGEVMGTPSYMAPEQAQGRRDALGPQTDVYALGAILYEMLTGRPPFRAASTVDTLVQVSFDEPVPPTRFQRTVPRDLETICLKCLRKEPVNRYATALDLASDLRRFLAHEPILARPVGSIERLQKWAWRQPGMAALIGLVFAVTVFGFVGISLALIDARAAEHNEALQREAAEGATKKARQALDRSERSVYLGTIHQARSQWLLNNVRTASQLLDSCEPSQRGWEWHYLRGLNHADLLTIEPPGATYVNGVAYSPDGRWLAASGGSPFVGQQSGIVQVCDATTGELRWRQEKRPFTVWCVVFSPDGKQVATCGGDWKPEGRGEMIVWDAVTGAKLHDYAEHARSPVQSVAFSPDGKQLVCTRLDRMVCVLNATTGEKQFQLQLGNTARSAIFTPDGRHLVVAGDDGIAYWDAATHKQVRTVTNAGCFALSADGKRLAVVTGRSGAARILDVSDIDTKPPSLLDVYADPGADLLGLAFSPDGRWFATAGADGAVQVWTAGRAAPIATYRGHLGRVAAIAFHPDGHSLASGGQQPGDVKVWDLTRGAESTVAINFGPEQRDIDALAFTANDRELLALGSGGMLGRSDRATGQQTTSIRMETAPDWLVPSVRNVFADQGRKLVAVSYEDAARINVWDVATARSRVSLRGHTARVWHIAVDRSGSRVVSASHAAKDGKVVNELKAWDAATGQTIWSENDTNMRTLALAVRSDGLQFAEARRDGTQTLLRLSSVAAGHDSSSLTLAAPAGLVRSLAFNHNGTLLAGTADNGSVIVWDARTGEPLHARPLEGLAGLNDLAFSPDGKTLAGVTRDRVVVWDVKSGQILVYLQGANRRYADNGFNPRVAWSEDGLQLAASNWDRTVSVWNAADALSDQARQFQRRQAAQRRYAWHLEQWEFLGDKPGSAAQEFHRRRAEGQEPPTADLRVRRAECYARQHRWKEALADYTSAEEPPSLDHLQARALLLLQTGDQSGYEKLLGEALAQPSRNWTMHEQWQLLRSAVLAPLPKETTSQAIDLSRKMRASFHDRRMALEYHGLLLLQTGQAAEAEQGFRQSLKTWPTELANAGLAVALLLQGDRESAKPCLTQTDRWLADQEKQYPPSPMSSHWAWPQWLMIKSLRKEAAALMAQ